MRRCPICGFENPTYIVEDINSVVLGCEFCLQIYREGRIQ